MANVNSSVFLRYSKRHFSLNKTSVNLTGVICAVCSSENVGFL